MNTRDAAALIDELDRGFRQQYLSYSELTAQLHGWAEAFPDIAHVRAIGRTPEERSVWLLALGPSPERARPAVWINGNMHAAELCGSSVALAIAEDVLCAHLGVSRHGPALPAHVRERLCDVLFYVVPRISPDGAEVVLGSGRYLRSVPRDQRPNRSHAYWRMADVDGDGRALLMRVQDPGGEFVASQEIPNLLVPREVDDPGPYYKLYPEGFIENFDGHTIPSPFYLSDNPTDLNRNFPFRWAPEPEQAGAGVFPMSEPESRAVVEFSSAHPNIFAWLDLHTFGGVFIRPLGDQPDTKMEPADLALYRQIGEWGEQHTGYPMVSGYEEFTYEPEKPLRGDLVDYAFHQRGCVAYVVELWDLFQQVGIGAEHERFVDRYSRVPRADMERLAEWDQRHNQSRIVRPWSVCDHPQLGPVEVGGVDPLVGVWNPPYERVAGVCKSQSAAFLKVAALAPAVDIANAAVEPMGQDLCRVTVTVINRGYLPTYILASAKKLDVSEPLYATVETTGCTLDPSSAARQELGHLDGWGRGRYGEIDSILYALSRGSTHVRTLSYVVRGRGQLIIRVGSCRVGTVERAIDV